MEDEGEEIVEKPTSDLDGKKEEKKKTSTASNDTKEEEQIIIPEINTNLINNSNVVDRLTQYGLENKETKLKIITPYGDIKVRLYDDTPLHRANFVMLTKEKYFDSTLFYRVINDFMIQGGNSDRDDVHKKMANIGSYTVPNEISPKHYHQRGKLAMAVSEYQSQEEKRSSPYNFYIIQQGPLSDEYMDKMEELYDIKIGESKRKVYRKYGGVPHLDGDFTVFGEVYSGMSVVDKIAEVGTDGSDRPNDDIVIAVQTIE